MQLDLQNFKQPKEAFTLYERIIEDRGSKYSVSIGALVNTDGVKTFLKHLKNNKRYIRATHNTYAFRIVDGDTIIESKNDDGEAGAGMVMLHVMQQEHVANCIICVTRWFGGTKLMGDRFRHVQNATKYAIDRI